MNEKINVAVDAMGGDNAPVETVKGAVDALNANSQLEITLLGTKEALNTELSKYEYPKERMHPVVTTEVIEVNEHPVNAIRQKKDSSIVRGMHMVRDGECDAFVTAGSSGATLAGGQLIVGRIRGIERPPFAPFIPTAKGPVLLIDCGANVDARPSHLVQFAQMGSIYVSNMTGNANPKVALVNIGTEEEKGNAVVKETYQLLKETEGINFVGNIEARDIPEGAADVVVCDAFVGNVILKMYEGVASVLLHEIKDAIYSTTRSKIGGLMIKPALKGLLKKFDASTYGGAPMLGLRGLVVKSHGNSEAIEIQHAIEQCITFHDRKINDQFIDRMHLNQKKRHVGKKAEESANNTETDN